MIIGEQGAVDELWAQVRRRMPDPRDDRPGQPVYVLEEAPEPGETGLRAATLNDLELLVPACAAAHREEIGIDPLRRDPEGFRWRTRAQIDEGRSWIWLEAGVIAFTKSVAQEVAKFGVTVNAICPGFVDTDMVASMPQAAKEAVKGRIPLGRFGEADEVARLVRFLCTEGDWITGAQLNINGGQFM